MTDVAVGIDIGGTNTLIGVIDRTGNLLSTEALVTTDFETIENFIFALCDKVKTMISKLDQNYFDVKGIGIGAPNGNCKRASIENAPNLKWKGLIPLKRLMQDYFDLPILITNDANAAALGEMVYGNAKDLTDFLLITLGTGLGSGFITAGKLMCGYDGFAGELGHTIAVVDGRPCGCGRRGCLETYVSAPGITKTVIELLEKKSDKSILRDLKPENIDAKVIYDAACKNDPIALEAFEYTGNLLGRKLSDTVAITNPQAVFLFGGLANAGEFIFKPTREAMEKNMLNVFRGSCKLLPSGIDGNNAGVFGASALIWKTTIRNGKYLCPGHHI